MKLKSGAALGPYRIVGELGRGGMGAVYKAYQPSLDRFVAIKVLPAFFAEDERLRARFKREAVTIAQLDHPAILPVYEYGERGHRPYIVMALAEGGTLANRAEEPMSADTVVKLMFPVADALDHAHERGILHRDVKPANVLLRQDGRPLLSDFGLARSADTDTKLTQSGATYGTPDYMAPELWRGEPAEPASDQYSLAVMCHELMTGRLPFANSAVDSPSASNWIRQPDLSQAPAKTHPALARALAKSPKDRFATCAEFVQALVPEPTSVAKPRSRPPKWAAAGVVLAVLIGGLVLLTRGHLPTARQPSALGGAPQTVAVVLDGLKSPRALALGADRSLYVADTGNGMVKKLDRAGKTSVIANNLDSPSGVEVDPAGNVYIAETGRNRILVVAPRSVPRVYAGTGVAGSSGDGGQAASAELSAPSGLISDAATNGTTTPRFSLWFIDQGNDKVREVQPDGTIISPTTITRGGTFDPRLASSGGIAALPNGNATWLYLSSASANQVFSRYIVTGIDPTGLSVCRTSYCMAPAAGTGDGGFGGDGADATQAALSHPHGIAVGANLDVFYIADTGNNRIRRVDHDGVITTVVGGGTDRNSTDPLKIQLIAPEAVVLAADGTLFIADTGNDRILRVAP